MLTQFHYRTFVPLDGYKTLSVDNWIRNNLWRCSKCPSPILCIDQRSRMFFAKHKVFRYCVYIHFYNLYNHKPPNFHYMNNMKKYICYNQWHPAPLLYMYSENYIPSPYNQQNSLHTQPPHTPLLPNKILRKTSFHVFLSLVEIYICILHPYARTGQ